MKKRNKVKALNEVIKLLSYCTRFSCVHTSPYHCHPTPLNAQALELERKENKESI